MVGVNIHGDVLKLQRDFSLGEIQGAKELSSVANDALGLDEVRLLVPSHHCPTRADPTAAHTSPGDPRLHTALVAGIALHAGSWHSAGEGPDSLFKLGENTSLSQATGDLRACQPCTLC